MNTILRFSGHPQNYWFTSDWHKGHNKDFIYKERWFESHQEHDKYLIEIVNSTVKPDDILFNLGDLCLNTSWEQFESFIDSIKCKTMYFIWGNHNSRVKNAYNYAITSFCREKHIDFLNPIEIYPLKYKNVAFLGNYQEITVNGQLIILSHYPICSWCNMHNGAWHLYGHVHSKNEYERGKSLDVGWDAFKAPISFREINAIMETKPILNEGHHY